MTGCCGCRLPPPGLQRGGCRRPDYRGLWWVILPRTNVFINLGCMMVIQLLTGESKRGRCNAPHVCKFTWSQFSNGRSMCFPTRSELHDSTEYIFCHWQWAESISIPLWIYTIMNKEGRKSTPRNLKQDPLLRILGREGFSICTWSELTKLLSCRCIILYWPL